MKKALAVAVMMVMAAGIAGAAPKKAAAAGDAKKAAASDTKKKSGFFFGVYSENASRDNHYIPSGWMGDYGDIKINPAWTENPRNGKYCFKVTYSARATQNAGWAGIFWQQPANNWGDKKGGYNLTGATMLTFWARGEKGGERIAEFKVGGITGEYPDSDSSTVGPIELTKDWQKYTIELKDRDLSNIIGGFCWSASRDDNPDGFVIYLDDVQYE
jgi:hypothetical protein